MFREAKKVRTCSMMHLVHKQRMQTGEVFSKKQKVVCGVVGDTKPDELSFDRVEISSPFEDIHRRGNNDPEYG